MPLSRTRELLLGRLRRRKTRQREGLFLAEGLRCATEILDRAVPLRFAVVSESLGGSEAGARVLRRLQEAGVEVETVAPAQLAALADTESPQGLLLVGEASDRPLHELQLNAASRVLLLDGVQDPGNLGTLLRAAAAFELDAVIALPGTVDPWNPKCVRASAGQIGGVPIAAGTWPALIDRLRECGLPLLISASEGEDVAAVEGIDGWALAVGNEGAGSGSDARDAAARAVAIPMAVGVDSLNVGVAGAILMYVLTRTARS